MKFFKNLLIIKQINIAYYSEKNQSQKNQKLQINLEIKIKYILKVNTR